MSLENPQTSRGCSVSLEAAMQRARELHDGKAQFHAPAEEPDEIPRTRFVPPPRPQQAPRKLLPLSEIAKRFAVSEDWLSQEIDAGRLRGYRLDGQVRVAPPELDAWLDGCRIPEDEPDGFAPTGAEPEDPAEITEGNATELPSNAGKASNG
jgi:hypothetical protein